MVDVRAIATKGAAFTHGQKGEGFRHYVVTDVTPTSITAAECPSWEDAMRSVTIDDAAETRAAAEEARRINAESEARRNAAIMEDTSFDFGPEPERVPVRTTRAQLEETIASLMAQYNALLASEVTS
jgi:hypothetical protein